VDFSDIHDSFLLDPYLGAAATYGGAAIRVCLSLEPEELSLGGQIVPQMISGKIGCKSSDVPGVAVKSEIIVAGVTYRVLQVQSDETGWTTLFIGKAY